jgi:hypothetical protein
MERIGWRRERARVRRGAAADARRVATAWRRSETSDLLEDLLEFGLVEHDLDRAQPRNRHDRATAENRARVWLRAGGPASARTESVVRAPLVPSARNRQLGSHSRAGIKERWLATRWSSRGRKRSAAARSLLAEFPRC